MAEVPMNFYQCGFYFKYDKYVNDCWWFLNVNSNIEQIVCYYIFMIIRISSRAVKGLLRPHLVRSYHAYDQTIKSLLDRAKSGETEEMQKKI